MKTLMEPLRNSYETPSTQKVIILRNFQYWPKFLVSYKKIRVLILQKLWNNYSTFGDSKNDEMWCEALKFSNTLMHWYTVTVTKTIVYISFIVTLMKQRFLVILRTKKYDLKLWQFTETQWWILGQILGVMLLFQLQSIVCFYCCIKKVCVLATLEVIASPRLASPSVHHCWYTAI